MNATLLPCPFCGGSPEADAQQGYRNLSNGKLESALSIYCTACNAHMVLCREDMPHFDTDSLMELLVTNWNHRCSALVDRTP